jgi:hypothetical protein
LGISTRLAQAFVANGNQLTSDPTTLQLGIHYRHSSLSNRECSSPLSLEPGDRAPDGFLLDARGNHLRLFDLFRGPEFTLLDIGGAIDAKGFENLGERYKQHLRTHAIAREPLQSEAYKAKDPVLVLIRPDGYVGWIGGGRSIISAESYLKHILNTN